MSRSQTSDELLSQLMSIPWWVSALRCGSSQAGRPLTGWPWHLCHTTVPPHQSSAPWCSSTRLTPEHAHTRETLHRPRLQTQTVTLPSTSPRSPLLQMCHTCHAFVTRHIFFTHICHALEILNADIQLSGSRLWEESVTFLIFSLVSSEPFALGVE